MYNLFFKRFIDFVISLFVLVILFPFILVVSLCLIVSNHGKTFFFQQRTGKNERFFKVIKFKTMTDEKDALGNFLPDAKRITTIGKFIRSTSLDELPQLINVLKGDMSLIGPRPLLIQYLPLYNKEQSRRHEILPGITGWAQVNGRNAISWQKKFEYDIWYVDHVSFLLDMKIFYLTIKKVFIREGINSESSATNDAFEGN